MSFGAKQRKKKINNDEFIDIKENSYGSIMRIRHPSKPSPVTQKKLLTNEDGHFLWGKEWAIEKEGGIRNLNEERIKVQSSVLSLVVKRMGENLLKGKSIMNTSMPI